MQNRVKLNSEKCKDLRISFVKNEPQFAPIVVDGKELERVTSAKLLGLTISSNLMWNEHISDVIKKASKCLYFLVICPPFTLLVYALFLLMQHLPFLCLAKVPKRRVGTS